MSLSHHGRLSDTTTIEEDHANERGLEEPRISTSELVSDITTFSQGVLCAPAELDPSIHAQPVSYSFLATALHTQSQTATTSSVLDPSSHVENVDSAFPELGNLRHSSDIGDSRYRQSLDTLSSFDPSSHAQNVHFTTLNPAEHVQACAFSPLAQLYAPLMAATADTSLDPQETSYPIVDIANYDSRTSIGRPTDQFEIMTHEFVPPEQTNHQPNRSMECMQYVDPERELRQQQINTPKDIDRPPCSQSTSTWQLGYQPHNFMVTA